MPDQPDEINILVPEHRRADIQRMITRRQAMLAGGGAMAAAYMAGCGGSSGGGDDGGGGGGGGGGGEESADAPPTPADGQVESGELLMANWVDYSDPENYKDFQKEFGLKVNVSGFGSNDEILAKLRAGGSKYDIISPTGYAVKTMADLGLIIPLTHELIPNLSNLSPAFKETDYDPGNKYSVAKDYGVTSFYWVTDKTDFDGKTIADCFEFLKSPEAKDLRVNFLEGGTQVMALALAALGYSINSEDENEIEEAKQLLIDVKPNVDTINSTFIERATRGEIDYGMGWNGDIRRAIAGLEKKGREMVFLIPEGPTEYWVDNWVIPTDGEHPVAAHKWINMLLEPEAAGREMNYHQYPVPVVEIEGVDPELAEDPVIAITDDQISQYESQIETPKGLEQRNRAYTEFKAA
jgi:spermidine/putrescine transport system substrate-binding protein